MTIEKLIKETVASKMEDGTVEKMVAEHFEKGLQGALDNLFRSYGDITKLMEDKIKSVMTPYLERYDYSNYIIKLDDVLTEVLKETALDNKRILNNFKDLLKAKDTKKEITAQELFDQWIKHVKSNVNTEDLEVLYEDGVSYESVSVELEVERTEDRSWSLFEYAILTLECTHDESMNFAIRLSRYKEDKSETWDINYDKVDSISSLRSLSDFEVMLMSLSQNKVKILLDTENKIDEVYPEEEPEASFS